jgi:hypothetical protein
MPVERQALIRFGRRKVQASFPPVQGCPPPQLGRSASEILRMGRAYVSARAMWLGTGGAIVDDTTVTFVAGCVSAAGV